MLSCRGDALYIEGVDVVGMAETTPTPFFLFSATQIDRNIAALRDSFRQFHPATRVFYASKVCSNLWFLDRVRRAGIEIEVNSGGELWKARKAGFEPRQIIFNGVAKTRAEVAAALEGPIEALVVDSVFELRRVADVAADLRKQARVALRVDLNVASETHPGLRTSKGAKAGIDVSEALGAFGLAAQLPNIDLVGMHYHIGSQITRVDPYIEALEAALALLTRIETAHDIRLEHLNIGGGFAIPYYDRTGDEPDTYFEAPHTLEGYAREIGGRVEAARPDLQLYLEPGRAIAGNSAILVSRVEAEKTKLVEATHGRISREDWLMIDTGVFRAKPNSHHQQGVQGQAARHLASPRNDHGIRPRVRGRRDGRHFRLRDLRLS
jgi:diaminopimelate decarboxylase